MAMTSTAPEPDSACPAIAVIIPHYNDVVRLTHCLAALAPQMTADTELVVVDNGSDCSLDPAHAVWPNLRLISEAAKGAALARNRGVAETTAPILAFLDCDCLPAADWLATARATATRPDGDFFGGRIDVFDETPPPRSGAEAFEAVFAFDWQGYIDTKGFTVTANMVTRRVVFADVGPFINGVSEDLDWCRRATAKGFRLRAAPALRVGHPSRSDWASLRRKWQRLTRESYDLEGVKSRPAWTLKALAMPISALAHLPKILTSPRLDGPGERLRGAATLIRLRLARMVWMLQQTLGTGKV
ncbi:MAG: glycosyltransferase family 2 protein [Paracoccaceae bacterium]